MILDKGICSIFHKIDASAAGRMPTPTYDRIHQSWYGELSFETAPRFDSQSREDVRTDARIRIHQCRAITNHDVVLLRDAESVPTDGSVTIYDVTRAWHGSDDTGLLVTDLTLET